MLLVCIIFVYEIVPFPLKMCAYICCWNKFMGLVYFIVIEEYFSECTSKRHHN